MGARVRYLALAIAGLALCSGLVIFLSQDRKAVRTAKLEKNLQRVGLKGKPDPEQSPRAVLATDTVDLGTVLPGESVKQKLAVHNSGGRGLLLKVGNSDSPHLKAFIDLKKIGVGESRSLEIVYDAPAEEGAFEYKLWLITNDPTQWDLPITVKGNAQRIVWTEPKEVAFPSLKPKEAATRELKVFSNREDVEIKNVRGLPPGFTVTDEALSPDVLAKFAAKSGRLLRVACDEMTEKSITANLTFDLVSRDGENLLTKSVPITAARLGLLALSHDQLDVFGMLEIGRVDFGSERKLVLFLEARGSNKRLELDRVEATPPFLKMSLHPRNNAEASGRHDLHLVIPSDAPEGVFTGDERGTVTLHFTDPEYPPLTFHPRFTIVRD